MDPSAFVNKEEWEEILQRNGCDEVTQFDGHFVFDSAILF